MPPDFSWRLSLLSGSMSIALLTTTIAYHGDLFTLRHPQPFISDRATPYLYLTTLLAFATFMLLEALIIPYVTWLAMCDAAPLCLLSPEQKGWSTCANIAVAAFFIIILSLTSSYQLHRIIWGKCSRHHLFLGIATWLVGYPIMVAASQLVAILISLFSILPPIEQIAVQELKQVQQYPWLLAATIGALVTLVPITEEVLFRGLLQSSLRCLFNRTWAIILSSTIFALFHFSPMQGISNFELLTSLFTLACFLGLLYERQGSLWAPIALHATFNAISIAMILI
jgi:hypothetical protein